MDCADRIARTAGLVAFYGAYGVARVRQVACGLRGGHPYRHLDTLPGPPTVRIERCRGCGRVAAWVWVGVRDETSTVGDGRLRVVDAVRQS